MLHRKGTEKEEGGKLGCGRGVGRCASCRGRTIATSTKNGTIAGYPVAAIHRKETESTTAFLVFEGHNV